MPPLMVYIVKEGDTLSTIALDVGTPMETIIAAKNGDRQALVAEVADLWFHVMVMLADQGLSANDVLAELDNRFGLSGIDEKAARG